MVPFTDRKPSSRDTTHKLNNKQLCDVCNTT